MGVMHIAVFLSAVFLAASAAKLPMKHTSDYLTELDRQVEESRVNFPPSCTPFYPSMIATKPSGSIDALPFTHGICVSLYTGHFVVVQYGAYPTFNIYYGSGLKLREVSYPAPFGFKTDCVFTRTNIYIADVTFKKILKYSASGVYQGEFAIGSAFFRMTSGGDYLYSTIFLTKLVEVYNLQTRIRELTFEITSPIIHGISMDTNRHLYITTLSNVVEKYEHNGHKIGEMRSKDLIFGDGITIDGSNNTIIADHADRVVIYDQSNLLIKKLWPVPSSPK